MNVTIDISEFKPSTLASMIADLLNSDSPHNRAVADKLLVWLENLVGVDESIEYLIHAGVTPELLFEE